MTAEDIINGNDAFLSYMFNLDTKLRNQKVPISGRPHMAMSLIAQDLKITIHLAGVPDTKLADQIHTWFEKRYGNRLKFDLSPGRAVILIRGDPYVMILPLIVGAWDGVLDVTKLVEGMTQPLFAELPEKDMSELVSQFPWLMERFQSIENLPPNVRAELDAAILHLMAQQPNYGLSKWASLQFAEKTLKYFIRAKKGTPANTHSLVKLLHTAENYGLPLGMWPIISLIQCEPAVRYATDGNLADAVIAHHASIDLCSFIGSRIKTRNEIEKRRARSDIPKIVISFSCGIAIIPDGGMVFKFVFADGKVARMLFAAVHLFWLQDQFRTAILEGRHADGQQDLVDGEIVQSGKPRDPSRLFTRNQPTFDSSDFEAECNQIENMIVTDHENGVAIQLKSVNEKPREILISSPVLNYWLEAINEGIIAGKEKGFFNRPSKS